MLSVKCSLFKRIGAAVTDLLICIFFGLILNFFVMTPVVNNFINIRELNNQLSYQQIKTYLYYVVDDEFNIVADGSNSYDEIMEYSYNENYYMVSIQQIYNYSESDQYDIKFYYSGIDKFLKSLSSEYIDTINSYYEDYDSIFTYDGNSYELKEDANNDTILEFCNNIMNHLPSLYYAFNDGVISYLTMDIMRFHLITISSSFGPILLINYIIFPLIFKNRGSIGKLIFSLAVVNTNYIRANKFVMIGRGLFIVVEILSSIVLFFIPIVISFLSVVLTRDGKSLHDLVCRTVVLDLKDFSPFKDKKEFKEFVESEREFTNKSLRRPYES